MGPLGTVPSHPALGFYLSLLTLPSCWPLWQTTAVRRARGPQRVPKPFHAYLAMWLSSVSALLSFFFLFTNTTHSPQWLGADIFQEEILRRAWCRAVGQETHHHAALYHRVQKDLEPSSSTCTQGQGLHSCMTQAASLAQTAGLLSHPL